jgi:hypothetical protein
MRTRLFALGLAGLAAAGFMLATASDADAQQRRRAAVYDRQPDRRVVTIRPGTQITVYRRSFLDAGTEVLPGERKFTDYVFPPGYRATTFYLGPNWGNDRRPLNDPFDLPGFGGHIAGF